jgi:alpha/beta superfamily hydrolase
MKQRFFGHPESPLFGVYHPPRGKNRGAVRAALVCPPIGQEYNRTHWTLRLMANQVARRGVHVLRMDYHGIGDSAQSVDEIDSISIWQNDIEQAIDHLKRQTGAETVMLVGQRFGGTLAAQVAMERPDVNSVLLWEPIVEGESYIDQLRKMHAQMLDLWVCKMATPNDDDIEEILGSQYRRSLLEEIEAIQLNVGSIIQPQLIVDVESANQDFSHPGSDLQKIILDPRATSWTDIQELESAFLRPKTMRKIVGSIDEMFKRLERFDALTLTGAQQ